ncbi:hypothetical protein PK35_05410 [Tamlana nanhaiensis]|uniref:Cytochrome oxidase subunit I profile domain-containing protein n=1 Tax=Neotamlana nanhaiensis TaxID=1382798 RepID=A0A0D7W2I5_9FLAO|nr:cbb3-type cytochrome c oxidase subunit I [Tamlana nanhaiensis]KJD33296.1 hypothetical protein PK35_05410 [Tamlana nanhaiensis]
MKFLSNKPHLIFLIAIPVLLLVGILSEDASLNINVHDTYFVISFYHLSKLTAILFGIIGFGYWIMRKTNRKLSKWLNYIHIGLTFGGIILIFMLSQLYREPKAENILLDFRFNQNLELIILIILLITVIGQVIYPINLINGICKKAKND